MSRTYAEQPGDMRCGRCAGLIRSRGPGEGFEHVTADPQVAAAPADHEAWWATTDELIHAPQPD